MKRIEPFKPASSTADADAKTNTSQAANPKVHENEPPQGTQLEERVVQKQADSSINQITDPAPSPDESRLNEISQTLFKNDFKNLSFAQQKIIQRYGPDKNADEIFRSIQHEVQEIMDNLRTPEPTMIVWENLSFEFYKGRNNANFRFYVHIIKIKIAAEEKGESFNLAYYNYANVRENILRAAQQKATSLDLSFKDIGVLPHEIAKLRHIKSLDLSNNQLTELPVMFGHLETLENLNLRGNQLYQLPLEMTKLKNLSSLDLSQNKLRSIPIDIMQNNFDQFSLFEPVDDRPQALEVKKAIAVLPKDHPMDYLELDESQKPIQEPDEIPQEPDEIPQEPDEIQAPPKDQKCTIQ